MVVILNSEFDELDDKINELYESGEIEKYMEEDTFVKNDINENDMIVVHAPAWRITDKNVIVLDGIYCAYNEESGEPEPDWSLALVYENVPDDEFDVTKWLYYEEGTPTTVIH